MPIFLYELGIRMEWLSRYGLDDLQKGMILFAGFLLGGRVFVIAFSLLSAKVISQQGTKTAIMISFLGKMFQILGLKLAFFSPWWLILAMFGFGLNVAFFFNSYHTLFAKNIGMKHVGEDVGLINFLIQVASVIAPTIAGVIIVISGYDALFLIGLALCMLGLAITNFMGTVMPKHAPNFKEFVAWLKTPLFAQKAASFAGRYFNDAAIALWPLYVFLILGSANKVGFLYSLSLFLAMILTFVTGFYLDHRKKTNKPFMVSGSLLSMLWLLRMNMTGFWNIAIVDTLDKLTSSVHWLMYDARYIGDGKGSRALSYFTYRELLISIFAVFFWIGVIALFWFVGNWNVLFILAAIGVMLSLLIRDHHVM